MRAWMFIPTSSQYRKLKGKYALADVLGEWLVVEGKGRHVRGKGLSEFRPAPEDAIGMICWPEMRKNQDLIPAWQVVREELRQLGRQSAIASYDDVLRSFEYWWVRFMSARRPLQPSEVAEEFQRLDSTLAAILKDPAGYHKQPWDKVAEMLPKGVRGVSHTEPRSDLAYIRAEVKEFETRVRTILGNSDLADLISKGERTIPDTRGRPRRGPDKPLRHRRSVRARGKRPLPDGPEG
jgi:hypothetical protein